MKKITFTGFLGLSAFLALMSCETEEKFIYQENTVTVRDTLEVPVDRIVPVEVIVNQTDTLILNIAGFKLVSDTNFGGAEISAFDPRTNRLFVTGGSNEVMVIDLTNPATPTQVNTLTFSNDVQSVAVNNGLLAVAESGSEKTNNGTVHIHNTSTYANITSVAVGALPDNVVFSKDGSIIMTANEGEPNDTYTIDPNGSVSIIEVNNNYAVTTIDFSAFMAESFTDESFRVYGPGASLAQDVEPEYVAISDDNTTAWVSLQENNAIAKVDIASKTITDIYPLGFKDYGMSMNSIDPSDRDGGVSFRASDNVFGIYQPDMINFINIGGTPYILSANEGDSRDYDGYSEEVRVEDLTLDAMAFPNASELQVDEVLGRLKTTTATGDVDGDGDFDYVVSYGARSFSVWSADDLSQVYDSGNELDILTNALTSRYDDARSDDKSVEPEAIATGVIGDRTLAFVGLERANAVITYDITNPSNPTFLQMLEVGVGPEGIIFIPIQDSPTGRPMLIVSSEVNGDIQIFQLKK